jgi:hypothetical protein
MCFFGGVVVAVLLNTFLVAFIRSPIDIQMSLHFSDAGIFDHSKRFIALIVAGSLSAGPFDICDAFPRTSQGRLFPLTANCLDVCMG